VTAARSAQSIVPVGLGRGVPAWIMRAAVLASGALVIAILATQGSLGGAMYILSPVLLASVYAPASPAPSAVVIGAAVITALSGDDPIRPAVLAMIPAVHLFHVCCGIAGVIPVRGRLHARAFVRPAVRFLLVQAVVFAFVGVAALLPTTPIPGLLEVIALAGLLGIGLAVALWHRQSDQRSDSDSRDDSHTGGGGR
jgi:hypothetical protein